MATFTNGKYQTFEAMTAEELYLKAKEMGLEKMPIIISVDDHETECERCGEKKTLSYQEEIFEKDIHQGKLYRTMEQPLDALWIHNH